MTIKTLIFLLNIFSYTLCALDYPQKEMVPRPLPKNEVLVIPALFSTPETGPGAGVGIIFFGDTIKMRDGQSNELTQHQRKDSVVTGFLYTQRKQFLNQSWYDLYLPFFDGQTVQLKQEFNFYIYPDFFFGIGNNTNFDDRELFTTRTIKLRSSLEFKLIPSVFAEIHHNIWNTQMVEIEKDKFLASKKYKNEEIYGANGGRVGGFGAGIKYDDRDNTMFTENGRYLEASLTTYDSTLGSNFNYSKYQVEFKHFISIAQEHVVGYWALMQANVGNVPFFDMAMLGGKNLLRGHFMGRYRDRYMYAAQTEYRFPLFWRFGGATFVGVGDVSDTFASLRENSDPKLGGGGGLRFRASEKEKVNLRLDLGFGVKGQNPNIYINIFEAF